MLTFYDVEVFICGGYEPVEQEPLKQQSLNPPAGLPESVVVRSEYEMSGGILTHNHQEQGTKEGCEVRTDVAPYSVLGPRQADRSAVDGTR